MKNFEEQFKDFLDQPSLNAESITALTVLKGQYDVEKAEAEKKCKELNENYQQTRTDYIALVKNTHFNSEPESNINGEKPKDLQDFIADTLKNKK